MPATDYLTSSAPLASFGRSIFSLRRDQSFPMDIRLASGDQELVDFQTHVADLLVDLAAVTSDEILSILWVRKLLDTFLLCLEEFRGLLSNRRAVVGRLRESLLGDFLERGVKALDFCNTVRDGVEQLRQCRWHVEIVLSALGNSDDGPAPNEGRVRRAKKAIGELTLLMRDERDAGSVHSQRNRSFVSTRGGSSLSGGGPRGHYQRSYLRLTSSSWSAARQLQAIGNNINPPRSQEIVATSGLAVATYTMNSVLFFVMWALVAAFPCQDRGLQVHFFVPPTYLWSAPFMSLYERIMELKKKDRRNSKGLLRELHQMQECAHHLRELTDAARFPVAEEKEAEIRQRVEELAQVCDAMKEWLDPMECQVREVFRRIARSRTEVFDFFASNR